MEKRNVVIGWIPDFNEGGTKEECFYIDEGRKSLTDDSWAQMNNNSHFFRVKVDLP